MIKLHQYPPMFGIPNPSPFCMKLETWLRMSGLPFEIVPVREHMQQTRNLPAFCERMKQAYYGGHAS